MLILTRKPGESIVITCEGQEIEVILGSINGQQVKLRFKAGKDVKIYRKELLDKDRDIGD